MRPIAYVMELTLGSTTYYLNLRREESASPLSAPRWLPVEFRESRLPWALVGSLLARQQLLPELDSIDGAFVHTTTLGLFCYDVFGQKPVVLSSDATPLQKGWMRGAYGLGPQGNLSGIAKHAFYRSLFRRSAGFVTWSTWSKASLVNDYGLSPDRVAVIPPGVPLSEFKHGEQRSNRLPRILFVGGDFRRKGGHLLLDVFAKRLQGRAELVIVTREPVPVQSGVIVHSGVSANSDFLRKLYATSDIFALPTSADCYSLVCLEALASGLPTVSTRVGGISDVVQDGRTGFLIDPGDAERLGDVLEELVRDEARRVAMGVAGRKDAEQRFDAHENARKLFEFVRSRC